METLESPYSYSELLRILRVWWNMYNHVF